MGRPLARVGPIGPTRPAHGMLCCKEGPRGEGGGREAGLSARTASGVIPATRAKAAMSQGEEQAPRADPVRQRLVVEYGVELDGVWLPIAMLRRLGAHGPWDRPLTEATTDQERVLVAHSLADRHNQNGLHRGAGLSDFIDAIPFAPTAPLPSVPDKEPQADGSRSTALSAIQTCENGSL